MNNHFQQVIKCDLREICTGWAKISKLCHFVYYFSWKPSQCLLFIWPRVIWCENKGNQTKIRDMPILVTPGRKPWVNSQKATKGPWKKFVTRLWGRGKAKVLYFSFSKINANMIRNILIRIHQNETKIVFLKEFLVTF